MERGDRPNTVALAQAKQCVQAAISQLDDRLHSGNMSAEDARGVMVEWRRLKEVIDSARIILDGDISAGLD